MSASGPHGRRADGAASMIRANSWRPRIDSRSASWRAWSRLAGMFRNPASAHRPRNSSAFPACDCASSARRSGVRAQSRAAAEDARA